MEMHQFQHRRRRLAAAAVCVAGLSASSAHADTAPPPGAQTYDVAMTFTTPTGKAAPKVRVRAAETFKVALEEKGVKMMASFMLTPVGTKDVRLEGILDCGNRTPARPVLITRLGSSATVKVQEAGVPGCELDMVVSKSAMAAPAK